MADEERPLSGGTKKKEEPVAVADRSSSGVQDSKPQSATKLVSRPSAKPGSQPGFRPISGKADSLTLKLGDRASVKQFNGKVSEHTVIVESITDLFSPGASDIQQSGESINTGITSEAGGSHLTDVVQIQSSVNEQVALTVSETTRGDDEDSNGERTTGGDDEGSNGEDQSSGFDQPIPFQGGDPPDGGDSDGADDGDDEQGEEGSGDGSDDVSDTESNEMVILEPDHPLMKRFQAALKNHLIKQNEKVGLELQELEESLHKHTKVRENIGVDLYAIQQELARYQMILERHHDECLEVLKVRTQEEQQLEDVRHVYKDIQCNVHRETKKTSELQAEVENLVLRLFYMQNAKEDVRADILIMKRAAEKAETDVSKAEEEKQKQDLFVDRLVERVDKLKEEIEMYDSQISAQIEETKAAKEQLMEAHMEIEAISLEKKQLYQQWNSSLIGISKRDEAHAAMLEALHQQHQTVLSLETEIECYRKSIQKEEEQNERLTLVLNKTERDIETIKKQLSVCQNKQDALKSEYATHTRILHETEQSRNWAMTEKTLKLNEMNALQKQIENEYFQKVKMEDDIIEKIQSQLTMDKAAHYTKKLTSKTRELTKQLETQTADVENELAQNSLDMINVTTRIEQLKKISEELEKEIMKQNSIIDKCEAKIIRRNGIIERKQTFIDQFNKKIEIMIAKAGGVELGPLEININSLEKSIDARLQDIVDLQQVWLRQQTELVRLNKEKDGQSGDVNKLKKQLTILAQTKARTEGEIDGQNREKHEIEQSISNMRTDMIRLNTLLHEEKGTQIMLQQDNILKENHFIVSLKERERESIVLQGQLDELKEEKERLLNSLVEAERQIMLWEKKTQLARETRAAVDSEVGQSEVRTMKAEIHRMQVRYSQLMKQQEKMIQDMEKTVSRRDSIVTHGDAQQKMYKKVLTKGTLERYMNETKKKIKQAIQEANMCDSEIHQLQVSQSEMSSQLERGQLNAMQLKNSSEVLDVDIDCLVEVKQKNMAELLSKQQKMKYFQQVQDGKYIRLCKSNTALESEYQKQVERMQALSDIVDHLNQEYPYAQPTLRRVTIYFGKKSVKDGSV